MAGHTGHVVSTFSSSSWPSDVYVCVVKGYLVFERVDVRGDFYGTRSSAVQEWNVRELIRDIHLCR